MPNQHTPSEFICNEILPENSFSVFFFRRKLSFNNALCKELNTSSLLVSALFFVRNV